MKQIPNFTFKDQTLLTTALTHRSALNESDNLKLSYERMEFLGDAILELIISDHLYNKYPDKPEGDLTNLRSQIVQTKTLATAAKKIKLDKLIILSAGERKAGGHQNPSLLADCLEAVIGAIYLDQGLEKTKLFISKNLLKNISSIIKSAHVTDYKSNYQELVQRKLKITPTYKIIKAVGPDHDKVFTVKVMLNNKPIAQGSGKSKQTAQQEAAKAALEKPKHF
jgi:ribonuclease III